MNSRHPSHPPGRLGLSIRGAVLAVVLTAGVTYLMLRSESSPATPPLVAAEAKVVPADEDEQNKPTKKSVDGARAADKTKPVPPGVGRVAVGQPALDDAAPSDERPAAGAALASDPDSGQVPGKPPAGASPAASSLSAAPDDRAAGANPDIPPKSSKVDAIVEPTPDSPAAQLDGAFVQVSAQKSESAAKSIYRGLRVKFPAIFGKLHPNIQRADLGDKGVYYRVRVGPFALADAKKICGNYKAAGGDCVIAGP